MHVAKEGPGAYDGNTDILCERCFSVSWQVALSRCFGTVGNACARGVKMMHTFDGAVYISWGTRAFREGGTSIPPPERYDVLGRSAAAQACHVLY